MPIQPRRDAFQPLEPGAIGFERGGDARTRQHRLFDRRPLAPACERPARWDRNRATKSLVLGSTTSHGGLPSTTEKPPGNTSGNTRSQATASAPAASSAACRSVNVVRPGPGLRDMRRQSQPDVVRVPPPRHRRPRPGARELPQRIQHPVQAVFGHLFRSSDHPHPGRSTRSMPSPAFVPDPGWQQGVPQPPAPAADRALRPSPAASTANRKTVRSARRHAPVDGPGTSVAALRHRIPATATILPVRPPACSGRNHTGNAPRPAAGRSLAPALRKTPRLGR